LHGLFGGFAVGGVDVDGPIVGDVDFDARGIDEALDDFAAGADEFANLVSGDFSGMDARGVLVLRPA